MKNSIKIKKIFVLLVLFFLPINTFAARLWSSGAELGTITDDVEVETLNSALTVQSTVKRSGDYSFKTSTLVSGTPQRFRVGGTTNTLNFIRFYFRVDTLPSAQNTFFSLSNASSSSIGRIYLTIDNLGVLRLFDEDGQITGTATLLTSTWYRIEVKFDTSGAAGSHVVEAKVDGAAAFASASNRSISVVTLDRPAWGANMGSEAQTTGVWYFDDLAINDNSGSVQNGYSGAGSIIHLQPDAAGDAAATAGLFSAIDEVTPNDATDFIEVDTDTGGQQANYNFESWTNAGGALNDNITLVQVGLRHRAEIAASSAFEPQIKSQSGGTTLTGTNYTQDNTTWITNGGVSRPDSYKLTSYTDPQAGGAWTPSLLDTMIAGVNVTDGDPDVHFSTIWALVEYVQVPNSISPSPSTKSLRFFGGLRFLGGLIFR